MPVRLQFRRGTASQWTSANPTLAQGELGLETDTTQFKIGDGTTAWNSLEYGGLLGPTGTQGTTGPIGATGSTGPIGEQGVQGNQGIQGTAGPTGPQGIQGPQGSQGIQGTAGATGPQGVQGLQGTNGTTGFTGPTGAAGADGLQGSQGIQGTAGPTGPQGIQGAQGSQGIQGTAGATGPQGVQGLQGLDGPTGPTGPTGIEGAQGPQGIQGIQGTAGPTGPQGIQGVQGNQGLEGTAGPTGPQGVQGLQGTNGATGWTGPTGAAGGGGTPGGLNTYVQFNTSGSFTGSANFVFDYTNNRVGIGTSGPASILDVSGSITNPIYLRAPTYSRVAVQDITSGTNTVTVAISNSGLNYNLSNSAFSNITLPASTTATTDGGVFWTFRNNTATTLSVALTNNANLTTPYFLPAGNSVTISISSNADNTYILL